MAVLAAAVLLFGACGGGNGESSTASPTTAGATVAPVTPTPAAVIATPPPLRNIAYRIEEGDALGVIAERYGVPLETIMADNGIVDETAIAIGQIITINGVDPEVAGVAPTGEATGESPIGMHMIMPLAGACLTTDDGQMPNTEREYRNGIHEGVDFFTGFACIDVPEFLPALATADGTVVRADHEYKQLTQRQIDELLVQTEELGYTPDGTLDKFRGRQVWIDHGNGIITRYCHLADIPEEVGVGRHVTQGETIGLVGDSGTPESIEQAGYNKHLHFEIRIDDSFLGAGEGPEGTRVLYEQVFGLQ